jgi:hypothetical protein
MYVCVCTSVPLVADVVQHNHACKHKTRLQSFRAKAMCVCVYIYIYIYIHTCMHIYTEKHRAAAISWKSDVSVYIHACMHIHIGKGRLQLFRGVL